jgi:hypothetical protein
VKSFIVQLGACSGCFRLGRQGVAPGITCAAVQTHGGAVCGVCPLCLWDVFVGWDRGGRVGGFLCSNSY